MDVLAWLIIFGLLLLGVLFLLAEMLLLPGVTVGAILSLGAFLGAIYVAFDALGTICGVAVIGVSFVVAALSVMWALRTDMWRRISLKEQVSGSVSTTPQDRLPVGSRGIAMSRLAPMGKAKFGDQIVEAKSLEAFIDPKCEVEIVGYDNSAVIVKLL